MLAIFLIKKCKTITTYGQKKHFTRRTQETKEDSFKETNVLTLNIRDDEDRQLNTMEDIWQNDFKRRSIKTVFHKEETIRKIAKMPEVLIIKYNRYRNNEQLNHYVKCNISIKLKKN